MFKRFRQRLKDMATIKQLSLEAEKIARSNGKPLPGAEHFVLASFNLPDGTGQSAFLRLGLAPEDFVCAIQKQYTLALETLGMTTLTSGLPPEPLPETPRPAIFKAEASGQALMQYLFQETKVSKAEITPLLGAHVLLAASNLQYGITPRAFHVLGLSAEVLRSAAHAEIKRYAD